MYFEYKLYHLLEHRKASQQDILSLFAALKVIVNFFHDIFYLRENNHVQKTRHRLN